MASYVYGRFFSSGGLQPSTATVGPFGLTFVFSWGKKFLVKFFLSKNKILLKKNLTEENCWRKKNFGEKEFREKIILAFSRWQLPGGSCQVAVGKW